MGGNDWFEPRLTPHEVYHGFIHPWDEETRQYDSIKAESPGHISRLLGDVDEGFGWPELEE